MTRQKLYDSNADRQRAWRRRRTAKFKELEANLAELLTVAENLREFVEKLQDEIQQCPAVQWHTRDLLS